MLTQLSQVGKMSLLHQSKMENDPREREKKNKKKNKI